MPIFGRNALAAVAYLRSELKSRNAAHVARLVGVGGATGMGSVVYALTAMSRLMSDDDLLTDAHRAATLLTDELIASDKRLDIVGGSAGAILGLLALYAAPGRTTCSSGPWCAPNISSLAIGSARPDTEAGQGPARILRYLTACRTAPRASPTQWRPWRR